MGTPCWGGSWALGLTWGGGSCPGDTTAGGRVVAIEGGLLAHLSSVMLGAGGSGRPGTGAHLTPQEGWVCSGPTRTCGRPGPAGEAPCGLTASPSWAPPPPLPLHPTPSSSPGPAPAPPKPALQPLPCPLPQPPGQALHPRGLDLTSASSLPLPLAAAPPGPLHRCLSPLLLGSAGRPRPLLSLPPSFLCRNLKPPSFITLWTGSRYCPHPQGASVGAGGRPLAPGKGWALTLWEQVSQHPSRGSTEPMRPPLLLPGRPQALPWRHRSQPAGARGPGSMTAERPLLRTPGCHPPCPLPWLSVGPGGGLPRPVTPPTFTCCRASCGLAALLLIGSHPTRISRAGKGWPSGGRSQLFPGQAPPTQTQACSWIPPAMGSSEAPNPAMGWARARGLCLTG